MEKIRIPLLNDRHTHVSFYAALGAAVDLSGCSTLGGALEALAAGPGPLIAARGWKDNLYDLPRADLDRLPPAAVCNISLHSFRLNSGARDLLRRGHPEIVANIDDQDWVERHLPDLFELFTLAGGAAGIPAFMDGLARQGVWAAADMLVSSDEAALALMDKYPGRAGLWASRAGLEKLGPAARSALLGIKLFADGALGARSAALKTPYLDAGTGVLLHTAEGLRTMLEEAAALAGGAAVHAIGDAALDLALDALEGARASAGPFRARIEHAQLITRAQALRARRLGVTLCMQPNFSGDSVCYADRLPAAYLPLNNPFRMLIDEAGFVPGADLVFGSDGMPHGAEEALRSALFPPYPGQRLTLGEFTAGYCLPDLSAGHIDAEIDAAAREVRVSVSLKEW